MKKNISLLLLAGATLLAACSGTNGSSDTGVTPDVPTDSGTAITVADMTTKVGVAYSKLFSADKLGLDLEIASLTLDSDNPNATASYSYSYMSHLEITDALARVNAEGLIASASGSTTSVTSLGTSPLKASAVVEKGNASYTNIAYSHVEGTSALSSSSDTRSANLASAALYVNESNLYVSFPNDDFGTLFNLPAPAGNYNIRHFNYLSTTFGVDFFTGGALDAAGSGLVTFINNYLANNAALSTYLGNNLKCYTYSDGRSAIILNINSVDEANALITAIGGDVQNSPYTFTKAEGVELSVVLDSETRLSGINLKGDVALSVANGSSSGASYGGSVKCDLGIGVRYGDDVTVTLPSDLDTYIDAYGTASASSAS